MIQTEWLKIKTRPAPLLLPILFMVSSIFLVGFLKGDIDVQPFQNILFWLLISLSLKMGFGHMIQEEQTLGILRLIAQSLFGLFRFIGSKILLHTTMIAIPSGILGWTLGLFDDPFTYGVLFLLIAILLCNQTTFELLLGSLKTEGSMHFLSALLIVPLEIPVLLSVLTPDLTGAVKLQILSGLLLVVGYLLNLTLKLLIVRA